MDGGNEQRVATNICLKSGPSAIKNIELGQRAYGNKL
jgi:hypothetical protein